MVIGLSWGPERRLGSSRLAFRLSGLSARRVGGCRLRGWSGHGVPGRSARLCGAYLKFVREANSSLLVKSYTRYQVASLLQDLCCLYHLGDVGSGMICGEERVE